MTQIHGDSYAGELTSRRRLNPALASILTVAVILVGAGVAWFFISRAGDDGGEQTIAFTDPYESGTGFDLEMFGGGYYVQNDVLLHTQRGVVTQDASRISPDVVLADGTILGAHAQPTFLRPGGAEARVERDAVAEALRSQADTDYSNIATSGRVMAADSGRAVFAYCAANVANPTDDTIGRLALVGVDIEALQVTWARTVDVECEPLLLRLRGMEPTTTSQRYFHLPSSVTSTDIIDSYSGEVVAAAPYTVEAGVPLHFQLTGEWLIEPRLGADNAFADGMRATNLANGMIEEIACSRPEFVASGGDSAFVPAETTVTARCDTATTAAFDSDSGVWRTVDAPWWPPNAPLAGRLAYDRWILETADDTVTVFDSESSQQRGQFEIDGAVIYRAQDERGPLFTLQMGEGGRYDDKLVIDAASATVLIQSGGETLVRVEPSGTAFVSSFGSGDGSNRQYWMFTAD